MLEEYLSGVFGDKNIAGWMVAWTFIFIGVIISVGIDSTKRDKMSSCTPYKFNLGFLFRDNAIRIIASIFVCFTIVRFGEEVTGRKITNFGCVGLGLIFDWLINIADKWRKKARKVYLDKEKE